MARWATKQRTRRSPLRSACSPTDSSPRRSRRRFFAPWPKRCPGSCPSRSARRRRHQVGEIDRGVSELLLIADHPALDQLAADLVDLGVVHREHAVYASAAKVEDREVQAFFVSAPDSAVVARRVASIFQADVVLV